MSKSPVLRVLPQPHASVRDGLGKLIVQATIDANKPIILSRSAPSAQQTFEKLEISGPERSRPICIVGAGCAGLYTAMILGSLDIPYEILEANDRIGGRIFTHHFNGEAGEKAPVNDPARYDYIDMGAMRYPRIPFMHRVFDLFTRLKMDDLLIQYKYSAANTFELYNGVRHNTSDAVQNDVDIFNVSEAKGGAVPDSWVAQGVDNVAESIFAPYAEAFRALPFDEAWAQLTEQDPYSTRGYLLAKDYPETVIEWLETFQTATGLYNDAFVESTMDAMDFGTPAPTKDGTIKGEALTYPWYCIDGGSDYLTTRMTESIKAKPQTGARVTKISSLLGGNDMQVVFHKDGKTESKLYSQVICTVPLGCLAAINIPPQDTSYMKRMAIRCLNYDTSTKVALKFATRWWEDPEIMDGRAIKGGISNTDLPIRTVVYPSYGFHATGPLSGVILASYTWARDAQRLGGLAQPRGSEAEKKRALLEKEWGIPTETDKGALGDLAILGDAQVI